MLLDRRGVSGGGKFIQAFCSVRADTMTKHETSRRKTKRNLWKFIPSGDVEKKVRRVFAENIEQLRVWFMWIWIKLSELIFSGGEPWRVVKVSRNFNLCTFCLKPLVFSWITRSCSARISTISFKMGIVSSPTTSFSHSLVRSKSAANDIIQASRIKWRI